ncbi:MAG: tyrosine-type recombinase/integrase [Phycisphaera sp.]|nr:tyrosine-type recombinase/integrase [Phycisphaera sp.]
MLDKYIAKRSKEPGKKKGDKTARHTIHNEVISAIKPALKVAMKWGYIDKIPECQRLRLPDKIGRIVTPEHFELIYSKCDVATDPADQTCDAEAWWQALLVFAVTTGWRISEILAFTWDEVDLESGMVVTLAETNKPDRDDVDYLPQPTIEHLKAIRGRDRRVFPWNHNDTHLRNVFHRIQRAAGIHLPCRSKTHQHSPRCHVYGFHALRRMCGTENAERLPAKALQKKMRHKSFETTQHYIGLAERMKRHTQNTYVPNFLKKKSDNGDGKAGPNGDSKGETKDDPDASADGQNPPTSSS